MNPLFKEWKILLAFALTIAAAAVGLTIGLQNMSERADLRREIRDIRKHQSQMMLLDSLQSEAAKHRSDSFKTVLADHSKKITDATNQLKKSNDKVDDLQSRIRKLNVNMPDFH